MTVYERNGYKNRKDYLDSLAFDYGDAVYVIAETLGEREDFDGLISMLEDLGLEGELANTLDIL